jgi:hypothetical protein
MGRGRFRGRESYARRGPTREPYDVVLIVCEGGKTEPLYLEGLRTARKLSSANIELVPMGRDPLSLVNHAIDRLEGDRDITRAYCVFDQDAHTTFKDAVNKARGCALGKSDRLRIAVSVPCFEVWPLLHFGYSTAEIVGGGGKTPGQKAVAELQKVMTDYSKTDRAIFEKLAPTLDVAMSNAARLTEHNIKTGAENPATEMHKLVEYLIGLKS